MQMIIDKYDKVPTNTPLRVMIAGPPAAGKGTQCERIVKKVRAISLASPAQI